MVSSILLQTRELVGHTTANQFRRSRPQFSRWRTERRLLNAEAQRAEAAEWLVAPLRGVSQKRIMYRGRLIAIRDGGLGSVSRIAIIQSLEELHYS